MNYIDLEFKSHNSDKNSNKINNINDVISKSTLVVLLGAAGSGKTCVLEKYQNDNKEDSYFLTVKEFIKLNSSIDDNVKILLLDGLDEYRSIENDKTFVITKLADSISKIKDTHPNITTIVISCREMDWYGQTDENALKTHIKEKAKLYSILPLDETKQKELADLLEIDPSVTEELKSYGLLSNPQMLSMLSTIGISSTGITSKKDLFVEFIKKSKEKNPERTHNTQNPLNVNEVFEYAGYIACYYIFCDIDKFSNSVVDNMVSSDYSLERLKLVLLTTLFAKENFTHRTIAEFLSAYYLFKHKYDRNPDIVKNRLKNLFIKNKKIPSELRGTFSWLCSLTEGKDLELIKIDPYYQLIYGDNSSFDDKLKKEIIIAVKQYSKNDNPYFMDFWVKSSIALNGFYSETLDDFLIQELKASLPLDNHYKYFISNIITAQKPNDTLLEVLLKMIYANELLPVLVSDIVNIIPEKEEELVKILDKIKDNLITDNHNNIKSNVLNILYPSKITPKEILPYLLSYQPEIVYGSMHFLFNTKYEDKYQLIDDIYQNIDEYEPIETMLGEESKFPLYELNKGFIQDYFAQTLLQYPDKLSAKKIYQILLHFKSYYKEYQRLKFSFGYCLKEFNDEQKQLNELADELFSLYIDDKLKEELKENSLFSIYEFNYFFECGVFDYGQFKQFNDDDANCNNETKTIEIKGNKPKVLLNKINQKLTVAQNKKLFETVLIMFPKEEIELLKDEIEQKATEFEFEDILMHSRQPRELSKIELKLKKEQQQRDLVIKKENEARKKEDEEYFNSRSDEQIQQDFNSLHYIAGWLRYEDNEQVLKYLSKETYDRLTKILKQAIFSDPISPEYLTLSSLSEQYPEANRNFDYMYYSSILLNKESDIHNITNIEFKKYLYMVILIISRISNIQKNEYLNYVDTKDSDFAKNTLVEYITLVIDKQLPEYKDICEPYLHNCKDVQILKDMVLNHNDISKPNKILYSFLQVFHFEIKSKDLKVLVSNNDSTCQTAIKALQIILSENDGYDEFARNEAIALYALLFYGTSIRSGSEKFNEIPIKTKIIFASYMLNNFNTYKSIKTTSGAQSIKQNCANFLSENLLSKLTLIELQQLKKQHQAKNDIWKNKIQKAISLKEQNNSDEIHSPVNIDRLKDFIISGCIYSEGDFFIDIIAKIKNLKQIIEDNQENDKNQFYNSDSIKNENDCRDVIRTRLDDKYGYDLRLTREQHIADNRVDLNIQYKACSNYQVQIECKRSDNTKLNSGLQDQLIDKYLSEGIPYGIYLIFLVNSNLSETKIIEKIKIPLEYEDKIKIICIDLTK